MKKRFHSLIHAVPLAAMLCVLPAHALYKVVGPDGTVTYTDRPPAVQNNKISSMGAGGTVQTEQVLPLELRQAMSRYPVTLYTGEACTPCEPARQLLRQRGIPYAEKQILTPDDAESLQRLTGGRDAPSLTIGAQALRGLSPDVWNSYLDSAGYPRESRLPANYQASGPTPLTLRRDAAPIEARRPAPVEATSPPAATTPASGIRF